MTFNFSILTKLHAPCFAVLKMVKMDRPCDLRWHPQRRRPSKQKDCSRKTKRTNNFDFE